MVEKTGLSLDEELFEWIESRRVVYEDGERNIRTRSEVIADQLRLARAVTEAIESADFDVARGTDRERWARQAMLDAARREK